MTPPDPSLQELVSAFGADVAARFATAAGEPEDHLRGPIERLVAGVAAIAGLDSVTMAGEERLAEIRVKPDYAVFRDGALIGFVEVKAPGKGADPNRFRDSHDKAQWKRLAALPNVLYTDGQEWGLWRNGEMHRPLWRFDGHVETAGRALTPSDDGLVGILHDFLSWRPLPPRAPRDLALTAARLCRLLRAEVREILASDTGMQALAADWRELLFPDADDVRFADEYAQTVTFALLLARVEGIDFADGDLGRIADRLGERYGLIGTALDVLTNTRLLRELAVSVRTLVRVFAVVDWATLSRGDPDAWLLFYEDFLQEYDPALRRATGSYYTPAPVASAMVRMADELLVDRFGRRLGFADDEVTVVDPGCGTGTFLLRVLDRVADNVQGDEGPGAVPARVRSAIERIIGFEIQAGPFAVAELRLAAESRRLGAAVGADELRLYVVDTLDDPYAEEHRLAAVYEPIARSRREASRVKREEPVLVVIGNPPYRERSKGRGGWIESGDPATTQTAPLAEFMPPKEWGLGAHVKHLYNPYVYFWRWGTWKVFDHHPGDRGIVSFISVSGFLAGPGFAAMRRYLRGRADAVWVIDLSPEGHQPEVATRVFAGVQQPVCITIAVRDGSTDADTPATVRYRSIAGLRDDKFAALAALRLDDDGWEECPKDWRAPFLPTADGVWETMPALSDLMPWSGSGIMPGRTWVVAPRPDVLRSRWNRLVAAPPEEKPLLLVEHRRDRTVRTVLRDNLPAYDPPAGPIGDETGACPPPVRIAYRSFDRQWLIPDKRVINQPNPSLWAAHGPQQVYVTALQAHSPSRGPAATLAALIPDLHHYRGSFGGRAFPLWRDAGATVPNLAPHLRPALGERLGAVPAPEDVLAYLAALLASPAYTLRFGEALRSPGLRVPLTADPALFREAVHLGRRVVWLHAYGERFVDAPAGRPPGPPRAPDDRRPRVERAIPDDRAGMPDSIDFDPAGALLVGEGRIAPVSGEVWEYEVSGYRVVRRWFAFRQRDPRGRRSSPLDEVIAPEWRADWTGELLDLLNVLTLLVDLEPVQADLLERVLKGPLISVGELTARGVLPVPTSATRPPPVRAEGSILDG